MEKQILRMFQASTEIRKIEGEGNERKREWVIHTDTEADRHETIIPIDKWNLISFNDVGAFYYMHQKGDDIFNSPDPDNALGPATAFIEDRNLIGRGNFEPSDLNPLADKIMRKVDFGTMKMTSVGFIPQERGLMGDEERGENPEAFYFGECELIEFSCVHVGSHRLAKARALVDWQNYLAESVERSIIPETLKIDKRKILTSMRMYEHLYTFFKLKS